MSNQKKSSSQKKNRTKEILRRLTLPLAFALIFISLAIGAIQNKSATTDEKFHLTRGLMLIETGDFRINQHHPILFNLISAIPARFNDDLVMPETEVNKNWDEAKKDELSFELIELNGGVIKFSEHILMNSRYLMITISGLFIAIYYLIVKRYFGIVPAIFSSLLLMISPTYIAHGSLVTTDVPSAITIFITTFILVQFIKDPSNKKIYLLLVLSLTVSLLTKYTAVTLLPIWLIFLAYAFIKSQKLSLKSVIKGFTKAGGTILITLFIIFLSYGANLGTIEEMGYNDPVKTEGVQEFYNRIEAKFGSDSSLSDLSHYIVEEIRWPAPQYVNGFIENVLVHNETGHSSFLLGEESLTGWPHYFVVAFALKETLGVILAFGGFITYYFYNAYKKIRKSRSLDAGMVLVVITPSYLMLLSMASSLNLGIRHIIPILLFVYMLIGWGISKLIEKDRKFLLIGILLIFSSTVSTLAQYPSYIGYFNELVTNPSEGDKYLRGSNYDWGQNDGYAYYYLKERYGYAEDRISWSQSGNIVVVSKRILLNEHERSISPIINQVYIKYKSGELKPIGNVMGTHLVFELTDEED